MTLLEIEGRFEDFRYRLKFSRKVAGWVLHHVQVFHKGSPLVSSNTPQGIYSSEKELLDHALRWCDDVCFKLTQAPPDGAI